jgi:hypothetical protein
MGRRRAAPSWPLLDASGAGGGDKSSVTFGGDAGCRHCRRTEGKAGIGQLWRRPSAGSAKRALAGRGQEVVGRELCPGEGWEEVTGVRRSDRRRVEA